MRVDLRVPVGEPLPRLAEFIERSERAGFHGVGVHDHHSGRDAYLALALAAARTGRLVLYPATSNTVTRDPVVLATLASSLAEVAGDRVYLTVAPGYLSVESAGRRRVRLEELREAITTIKRLLAGDAVTFNGTRSQLRFPPRRPPPVLVTASGPRLLELAGEVADGALMFVGLDPAAVAAARRRLQAGAERAGASGRDPDELEQVFIVPTAVGDRADAVRWPRRWFRPGQPWLAYPSRSNLRWLRAAGFDLPDDVEPEALPDDLCARICDALGLFGPPEHCADRLLEAREQAGVEHVFLFPSHTRETGYDLPHVEVEAFATVIGPRLARSAPRG